LRVACCVLRVSCYTQNRLMQENKSRFRRVAQLLIDHSDLSRILGL
jgi:hypothetical protein